MRAFLLNGYGAIQHHVRLAEIADPVAGDLDVLVEIHAASLNPIDFKIVRGDSSACRNTSCREPSDSTRAASSRRSARG